MRRLFIAFEVSDEVLEATLEELRRLKRTGADVKWAARDHLHVTLRFLGATPEESVGKVEGFLREACAASRPLELQARGVGSFPPGRDPKVVWIGVEGRSEPAREELHRLRARIHAAANALGLETDRDDFRPHLTLGRVKGRKGLAGLVDVVKTDRDRGFGSFGVESLVLFESRLSSDGSTYSVVGRVGLG